MPTFKQFYERLGFKQYPFREKTAESEDVTKLFVAPPHFPVIKDVFDSRNTAIISGNRGTGKTILLDELRTHTSSNIVVSNIDNYESINLKNNLLDFYDVILQHVVSNSLVYVSSHKKALKNLNSEDKMLLSFLITKYADCITNSGIAEKIEEVQLNPLKRLVNKFSAPLTLLLNFGTTAIANFGNDLLNRNFSPYLPKVSEGEIRRIIPDIQFKTKEDFKTVAVSYSLLDKALRLIEKMSGNKPLVIFDKLDEDIRLENDADLVAEFIKAPICDNKLLLNDHIQLLFSVWEIPFNSLESVFRQSKHIPQVEAESY